MRDLYQHRMSQDFLIFKEGHDADTDVLKTGVLEFLESRCVLNSFTCIYNLTTSFFKSLNFNLCKVHPLPVQKLKQHYVM
jgi:hypothetical protein